jgi:hypothetical protein
MLYILFSIFYTPTTALYHAEFIASSLRQNLNAIKKNAVKQFDGNPFFPIEKPKYAALAVTLLIHNTECKCDLAYA